MDRNKNNQKIMRRRVAKTKAACHICGRPVDYNLRTPDPQSFVIDHVIPLSRGGRDDLSNIRAAHRICNARKAARDFAPIIRRSPTLNR